MDWLKTDLYRSFDEKLESCEYLSNHEIIGLFFSAKWCKPCRDLEEKLSLLHKFIQAGDTLSFGVIVVSDDKDEEEYSQHISQSSWPAIPYRNSKLKAKLKRQYHVTAVPKLVILESRTGRILNHDAKIDVEKDLKGAKFPWTDPTVADLLKGEFIYNGTTVSVDKELISKRYLGIYFSAEWCPPCRMLLPTITQLQDSLKENGFEVVYCSLDKSQNKFDESTLEMPWHCIPWNDARIKQMIKLLHIEDIPQLVIWDCESSSVLNKNAVPRIKLDPLGKEYPWSPQNLTVLSVENVEEMSQCAVFLFITENNSDLQDLMPKIEKTLNPYKEDFRFYVVSDEEHIVARLRDILKVGDQCPYLLFLDFETKVWARCMNKHPTDADVIPFVEAVKSGLVDLIDFPEDN